MAQVLVNGVFLGCLFATGVLDERYAREAAKTEPAPATTLTPATA